MIHPWLTPEFALRLSGFSFFSLLAVLEVLVGQGRYRIAVTSAIASAAGLGMILLGLAILAGIAGQPGYVVCALGVPALVLSTVFGAVLVNLPKRYTAGAAAEAT